MIVLSLVSLVLASIPAIIFLMNLSYFKPLEPATNEAFPSVSVLIPARDEAASIRSCVEAALASSGMVVEVIVLDDHSTDGTADIVRDIACHNTSVHCIPGDTLPGNWNGKQFACNQLAKAATFDLMLFIDADVRLSPDAIQRLVHYKRKQGIDLLSSFPHQRTGTLLEKGLIPLMHYLLLGYLPFSRMRSRTNPSLAAGCGQLFLTSKDPYRVAGTHAAIAGSRHDGIKLPRAYRNAGLVTDVVDGTDLAECRMYSSASEVVRGLLKNATEGIASGKLIIVFTVLLVGACVLPALTWVISLVVGNTSAMVIAAIAIILGHLPRAIAAIRFRQSLLGVIIHSFATLLFVSLQWIAFALSLTGHQVAWRGRQ